MNTELELMRARLNWLENAFKHMPDLTITFNFDDGEEDSIGMIPKGWNIRCDSVCVEPLEINAPEFHEAIDRAMTVTELT